MVFFRDGNAGKKVPFYPQEMEKHARRDCFYGLKYYRSR